MANRLLDPLPLLKKGLILELLKIKRSKGTWPLYRKWIEKLHSNPGSPSVNALRQSVLAVETKSEKIKKNCTLELEKFMQELYKIPGHALSPRSQ